MNTNKKDGLLSLGGVFMVFLFIVSTDPRSLSAFWLLLLPFLIAMTVFTSVRLFLRLSSSMSAAIINMVGGVAAAGSLLVVLLSSLGQFGPQDGLLALLLVTGLVFYFRNRGAGSHAATRS